MTDPNDPIEEEPTAEEVEEAEALASALDKGGGAPPDDALQAAALLRYSRDGGALSGERRDAILDEVLDSARPRPAKEPVPSPLVQWLRWLVPAGGLAAAAAVAIFFVTRSAPVAAPTATSLPSPDAELLAAQAAAAGGDPEKAGALAGRMRDYRGSMYAALGTNYGGGTP